MTKERSLFLPNKFILTEKELKKVIGIAITYITSMSYIKIKSLLYFLFYTGVAQPLLLTLTRAEIGELKAKGTFKINKHLQKLLNQYYRTEEEGENAFNVTFSSLLYLFVPISKYYGYNLSVEVFRKSFIERNKQNERPAITETDNKEKSN